MEKLLTESELAQILVMSVLTVRRNRSAAPHRLPPHVKFGSSVRYRLSTVLEWLAAHEVAGETAIPSAKTAPTKQTHRGAPTKAERVTKVKNANK